MQATHLGKWYLRQALRDRALLVMLGLLAASLLPFFTPGLEAGWARSYALALNALVVMPACVVVLWPLPGEPLSTNERSFWRLISSAYALWWLVGLVQWRLPADSWSLLIDMGTDASYVIFYALIFVAVAQLAMGSARAPGVASLQKVRSTGFVLLSFWLYCYFALIPVHFQPELYESSGLSLVSITLLDLLLMSWLVALAIRDGNARSRAIYWLLAALAACHFAADALESWYYFGSPAWLEAPAAEALWYLPTVAVFVVARARRIEFPAEAPKEDESLPEQPRNPGFSSPTILLAFVLPICHLLLEMYGNHSSDVANFLQSTVVLWSIVSFLVMAMVENRAVREILHFARRQAEKVQGLRIAQEVTAKSEQTKALFLANVGHELRTPLNGILGMSNLLLGSNLNDEQRRRAELLKTSTVSLAGVINDILDYSRTGSGDLRSDSKPFEPAKVARQTLDLLQVAAQNKGIDFELEVDDTLPERLNGDSARLRQVLMNLVGNAIKFSDQGPIRVRFMPLESSDSTVRVRCEVIDRGPGVPPDKAEYVFLPFAMADESHSRKHGGSGLGLAISRQLTEMMGGSMGVSPNPAGGSVFWFEIPFAIALPTVEEAPVGESGPTAQQAVAPVLLVEDDQTSRLVISAQIRSLGHQLDTVANGAEALQALARGNYSVVLMDCDLPEMGGLEVTRRIRSGDYGEDKASLPIVGLVAPEIVDNRADCMAAGMDDHLDKPVELESLRQMLDKWIAI